MSFQEVQRLLHLMNVKMDQEYAFQLFQVSLFGERSSEASQGHVLTWPDTGEPIQHHSLLNLSYMPYHYARFNGECRAWFLHFRLLFFFF